MRTLAERVEEDGALPARDAVRLIVRLAKTLEQLHARGEVHGRLGPRALALPGPRIASARLRRPSSLAAEGLPSSSRDDDAYAAALLLYFALTGAGSDPAPATKLPSLAVFDAGDDALDAILAPALTPGLAGLRDLAALRRDLEQWLDDPAQGESDPLPWEDAEAPARRFDLSSLPPPPQPAVAARGQAPSQPDEDERETLPGESPAPHTKRPPRIVPPKIALQRSKPPPLPKSEAEPPKAPDSGAAPKASSERSKPGTTRALVAVGGAAVVVIGGYLALRSPAEPGPPLGSNPGPLPAASSANAAESTAAAPPPSEVAPSATASVQPALPAASTSSVASAAASAASAAAPSSAAPSSAAPSAPPASVGACLQRALPADTFAAAPSDVDFLCSEADVVKGAGRLRTRIVIAGDGRGVTEGMKEWSLLGGYELAAYAALRAECCPGAGPSTAPASPQICSVSIEAAVQQVALARAAPAKDLTAATEELDRALRCVVRAKQGNTFGGHPKPSGGEGTMLRQIFKRMKTRT